MHPSHPTVIGRTGGHPRADGKGRDVVGVLAADVAKAGDLALGEGGGPGTAMGAKLDERFGHRIMDDLTALGAKGIIITDIRTCRI